MELEEEQTVIAEHPPAPHFDDEATLVAARPVVPIATAEAIERSGILRRALPFIVIAGLIGVLIGGAVVYYAKRHTVGEVVESSKASSVPAAETSAEPQQLASQTASDQTRISAAAANDKQTSDELSRDVSTSNAARVSRARRQGTIRVSASANKQRARRGASRIQEIFAGSNPE